jgi:hypothetical protein
VAAYDAGAIAEWLAPSGGGRLAPLRDESGLADAMTELLRDDVWKRSSTHAFEAAQAYRPAAHVDRIEALYAGNAEHLRCPAS